MWTTEDLLWLTTNYPSLKQKTSNIIEGRLSFRMLRLNGKYVVNPGSDLLARTKTKDYLYIFDTYNVRIEWKKDHTLPIVFETGGKLADVAKLLNKRLIDMHQFEDGALCLASPIELRRAFPDKVKLDILIENFVIPYLFAQSYFAKHKKWIWGDLSHGYWGLIEWLGQQSRYDDDETKEIHNLLWDYGNNDDIALVLGIRYRAYKPCLCMSGKKVRECHPYRQLGLARIRGAIARGVINVKK